MPRSFLSIAVCIISLWFGCGSATGTLSVTNVLARQRLGTKFVDISYALSDNAPNAGIPTVTVGWSTNGGVTFTAGGASFSGALGFVLPGTSNHITWNAALDLPPFFFTNVVISVTASNLTLCLASQNLSADVAVPASPVYQPYRNGCYYQDTFTSVHLEAHFSDCSTGVSLVQFGNTIQMVKILSAACALPDGTFTYDSTQPPLSTWDVLTFNASATPFHMLEFYHGDGEMGDEGQIHLEVTASLQPDASVKGTLVVERILGVQGGNPPGYHMEVPVVLQASSGATPSDVANASSAAFTVDLSPPPSITALRVLSEQADVRFTDDINTPIKPVTDTNVLGKAPLLGLGVVADGVTPVLFEINAKPGDYTLTIAAMPPGSSSWYPISEHLSVLRSDGWLKDTNLTVVSSSGQNGESFAYLEGLDWRTLLLLGTYQGASPEAQIFIKLASISDPSVSTNLLFKVRPPPVVLVHGYATDNKTWGPQFLSSLQIGRPTNFIVAINYGVSTNESGLNDDENTSKRLDELSWILDDALSSTVETGDSSLRRDWAFTRYDIAGDSQGGVLSRMLCTAIPTFGSPFRSRSNLYRGRFRRIITIGSPHNGSLLLYYLLRLRNNISVRAVIPAFMDKLVQSKFDPFGPQISEVNDTNNVVDPGAKFRLIRCTIMGGKAPSESTCVGAFELLGLCNFFRGQILLPSGSDGVVDFYSQGAGPNNSISDLGSLYNISHSDNSPFFGVPAGNSETTSSHVADEVLARLDSPASNFGAFQLPTSLPLSLKASIDSIVPGFRLLDLLSIFTPPITPLVTSVHYELNAPADAPVMGEITWFAEAFTTNGVVTDGVSLALDTNNPAAVTVIMDDNLVGDVVLYASYPTTNNTIVAANPTVVVSSPARSTMTAIEVVPASATMSLGDTLTPSIWAHYGNGIRSQIYIPIGAASFSSSDTNVATVEADGTVTLTSFGHANIKVAYNGFTTNLSITSVTPVIRNLAGALTTNGYFQLVYSGTFGMTNVIEASTNLADWTPLATLQNTNGFVQYVDPQSPNRPARFYRVRIQ